ncbi:MAG: cation transporter [Thermoplasmata archaeon]|nr:cation transporter [Thermoplasmata archaeon]
MLSPTISYSNTIIIIEIELSVLFLLIIASLILHRKNEIIEKTLFFESINDSFSTFAAIVGILLVNYGHYIFDGIVSILIACMISYNAVKLIRHNARLLLGMSLPNEFYNEVERICRTFPGVKGLHDEADALSEKMAKKIEKKMPNVRHVMIHFCLHYRNKRKML